MKKKSVGPRGGGRMPVSRTEKQVMTIFKRINKAILKEIGHSKATTDTELTRVGKLLLGKEYSGTFTVDHKPSRRRKNQYFIINNKPRSHPGEHWIAVVKQDQTFFVYDSFGRSSKTLIPSFVKGRTYFDSDSDAEQHPGSSICGSLCLSFLVCFDRLGKENAMRI